MNDTRAIRKNAKFSKKVETIRKLIKFCILHSSPSSAFVKSTWTSADASVQTPNVPWRDNFPWGLKYKNGRISLTLSVTNNDAESGRSLVCITSCTWQLVVLARIWNDLDFGSNWQIQRPKEVKLDRIEFLLSCRYQPLNGLACQISSRKYFDFGMNLLLYFVLLNGVINLNDFQFRWLKKASSRLKNSLKSFDIQSSKIKLVLDFSI